MSNEKVKLLMTALVSAAVLASALYVILAGQSYPEASSEWAFGMAGLIVGYWLK